MKMDEMEVPDEDAMVQTWLSRVKLELQQSERWQALCRDKSGKNKSAIEDFREQIRRKLALEFSSSNSASSTRTQQPSQFMVKCEDENSCCT